MSAYEHKEIKKEDGTISFDDLLTYISLNYETGDLTELSSYTPAAENSKKSSAPLTIKNGNVYCEEKLDDAYIDEAAEDYETPESIKNLKTDAMGVIVEIADNFKILTVTTTVSSENEYTVLVTRKNYTYLVHGNTVTYLDQDIIVHNAYRMGNDVYFTAQRYMQTIFKHFRAKNELFKLDNQGNLTALNNNYADYNSMEIIGSHNGNLILKCQWMPEETILDEYTYSVSPLNDGYFTFDGEKLSKIGNYVYSDTSFVSPDGDIFAIVPPLGKIIKVTP